ncbi:hypothetical protein AYI69_g9676 [Smittium culicis]|uniref:Uncharacterized protein n=1 Tax=Smittium culicis TaxID=133412 RepID=A0A1R1XB45_9FUNG|nr:hypothetical protein AYI69_g9676 [Smittium culicis]
MVCWNCVLPGHRRSNCNKLPIQHNKNGGYSFNQNNYNNRKPSRNYKNHNYVRYTVNPTDKNNFKPSENKNSDKDPSIDPDTKISVETEKYPEAKSEKESDSGEENEEYFTASETLYYINNYKSKRKNIRSEEFFRNFNNPTIRKKTKFFSLCKLNNGENLTIWGLNNNDPNSPYFQLFIKGTQTKILFDSGAAKCFISDRMAKKLNIKLEKVKSSINAITAD